MQAKVEIDLRDLVSIIVWPHILPFEIEIE